MENNVPKNLYKASGIYIIKNSVDNRFYIGSTSSFYDRFRSHKGMLKSNSHHSRKLQKFYNQHGSESLSFNILELANRHDMLDRERHYIKLYKTHEDISGFNVNPMGSSTLNAISLRIDEKQIEYLKYLARYKSIEVDGLIYTDLVRYAIEHTFPIPKNFNPNTMDLSMASGVMTKKDI